MIYKNCILIGIDVNLQTKRIDMKITIETLNFNELEKILALFQKLNIKDVQVTTSASQPMITKGNKSANPRALFGMWKDNPRDLKEMRKKTWSRNWDF